MQNLITKTKKTFNNKYTKYFLIGTFVLIFLFILNYYLFDISIFSGITHAAGDGTTNEREWVQLFSYWLRTAYVVLWPLLTVAGASLSNELVYGSVFGLEVPLWNLWNVMKNFANYSIGFLFVVSVFVSLFSNNEKFNPKKLIPKLIIAAVSIQASWFLVGVLVDLSTILTYSFGMLPIDILGESDMFNKPMIQSDVLYSMEDDAGDDDLGDTDNGDNNEETGTKKDMLVTYNYGSKSMVPCLFSGGKIVTNENKNGKGEFTKWIEDYTGRTQEDNENSFSVRYCMGGPSSLIDMYSILDMENVEKENASKYDFTNENLEKWKENTSIDKSHFDCEVGDEDCPKLSNISDKANGAGGIFYGLYGSILNMSDLLLVDSKMTTSSLLFETVIKLIIGAALIIPLFTLAVVLIMRVVVLWGVIAFSPIIIAAIVFGFSPGSGTSSKLMNPKNILTLIFIPVVTTFALSISVIFLSLISNQSGMQGGSGQGVFGAIGMSEVDSGSERCIVSEIIGNKICFNYPENTVGSMLDLIGWLLVNIFGIAFMWTVVFAALKTSKITESTVKSIQGTAEGFMKAAPIIPTPGAGMTSVGALDRSKRYLSDRPEHIYDQQYQKDIKPFMTKMGSTISGDTNELDDKMKENIDGGNVGIKDWEEYHGNLASGTNIKDYNNALPLFKKALENESNIEYTFNESDDWDDVMATNAFDQYLVETDKSREDFISGLSDDLDPNNIEFTDETTRSLYNRKIDDPNPNYLEEIDENEYMKYVYNEGDKILWIGDTSKETSDYRTIKSPSDLDGLTDNVIDKLKDKFDDYSQVDSNEEKSELEFDDEVIQSSDDTYYGFKKKENNENNDEDND